VRLCEDASVLNAPVDRLNAPVAPTSCQTILGPRQVLPTTPHLTM
jgi:hypothetical protein